VWTTMMLERTLVEPEFSKLEVWKRETSNWRYILRTNANENQLLEYRYT
jgi:hypothetical protein